MKVSIVYKSPASNVSEEYLFVRDLQSILRNEVKVKPIPDINRIDDMCNFTHCPLCDSDLVVSVGGDGTLLRAVTLMGDKQRPIIGVNFGTVGFLTDIERGGAIEKICEIVTSGTIKIERRMRIDIISSEYGKLGTALNEVVFRSDYEAIKIGVSVDGVVATEFRGDGLIVSTPTGSTAYALSSGGPITDPRTSDLLLVPIAPYLLSSRPQVVHGGREVSVCAHDGVIIVDGRKIEHVWPVKEHEYRCVPSDHPAQFVDVGRNFFEKVNTKLKTL